MKLWLNYFDTNKEDTWKQPVCDNFQVRAVYLHPEPFSVDNDLLTPTMKNKRTQLRRTFQCEIQQLYAEHAVKQKSPEVPK